MGRKRAIAPTEDMQKLLALKKEADAKFERELKQLESARRNRWLAVGQIAEEAGISSLSDSELRAAFRRILDERPPQAAPQLP